VAGEGEPPRGELAILETPPQAGTEPAPVESDAPVVPADTPPPAGEPLSLATSWQTGILADDVEPSRPGPVVSRSDADPRAAPRELTAKVCIDASGTVTSVTVLSDVSPLVRASVGRTLSQWRYSPVVEADHGVSACFASAFRVHVE
jgi:hypothetical protein